MKKGGLTLSERFRASFLVDPETGCWVWQKSIRPDGYGQFMVSNALGVVHQPMLAHRISYLLEHGEIPIGLQLDHLCRNRACVNPRHLEAVTGPTNMKRGMLPNMVVHRMRAEDRVCKKGHPVQFYGGRLRCRQCTLEANHAGSLRKRGG